MNTLIHLGKLLRDLGFSKEGDRIEALLKIGGEEPDLGDWSTNEVIECMIDGYGYPEWVDDWESLNQFFRHIGATIECIKDKEEKATEYFKVVIPEQFMRSGRKKQTDRTFVITEDDCSFYKNSLNEWICGMIESYNIGSNLKLLDFVDVKIYYPDIVYHGTVEENVEGILKEGLRCSNVTRGISNRWVGSAIFTSSEIEGVSSYGDYIFEINLGKMKRDGLNFEVSKEPDIEEMDLLNSFCYKFRVNPEDLPCYFGVEAGMEDSTYIIHSDIPPQYIKLIEGEI